MKRGQSCLFVQAADRIERSRLSLQQQRESSTFSQPPVPDLINSSSNGFKYQPNKPEKLKRNRHIARLANRAIFKTKTENNSVD